MAKTVTSDEIGVTGVTGRLGGRIARRLSEAGVPQRMLARDPARAPRLPGASAVRANFDDRQAVGAALTGTRTVLMVSASETADRVAQHFAFVDAAAAVTQGDIADAAAAVLLDPAPQAGATYSLTGPEALSLDDVAAVLTAELGRPVTYQRETIDEAYASRAGYGAPDWQVDAWVSTYTAIANGEFATVTDDVRRVTGHQATSLGELLRGGAHAY